MLKEVTLGLSGRVLINNLVSQTDAHGLQDARQIRALRRDLALRAAEKDVQRREEAIADLGARLQTATKEEREELTAQLVAAAPTWANFLDLEEKGENVKVYTVESAALSWLSGVLEKHNWGQVKTRDGRTLTVAVDGAMLEVVAIVADAVSVAISGS